MKQAAAMLLVVILAITTGVFSSTSVSPVNDDLPPTTTPYPMTTYESTPPPPPPQTGNSPSGPPPAEHIVPNATQRPSSTPMPWRVENLLNPQEVLLQEIRSLDEESTDEQIQKVLVKAMEADTKSNMLVPVPELADKLELISSKSDVQSEKLSKIVIRDGVDSVKELMEDEEDSNYNETDDILMNDDGDWDDDDDDDDIEDDIDDEEEILFDQNCPTGCRCSEQYTGVTIARCTKISSDQTFGPDMAHLRIENAADFEMSAHSLREKGLHHLQSIAIVDTRISALDRTAFDGVSDLFTVNLTRNGLMDIHPDTFQNNTQLSLLTVSGNPLQFTQGKNSPYAKYFLDAPTVSELDLSNNSLPRLLPTTFARMPRLVYLSLKNNKLRAIDKAIFKSLDQLEEVDLSNNQLNGLPADVFDANEYLEILHISGNNLTTLATIKATRLDSLDASKNRIKIVAKDDLAGIPELEKLYLRSNGLKRIHPHAFVDLLDLTYLDISNNKMTALEEHHLRTNSRLETLIMNDNPGFESLPVFKSEDRIFRLNRFECADCGLLSLETGTFDAMPAMTRLNLARNRLRRFPNGLLRLLSTLRELDLSDNLFRTLDVDMFRGATALTKLNLAGNPLTSLQAAPFLLTPSLSRMDVSRCALSKVWSDKIAPLQSLRFLSVRGNRIERIDVEDLEATPKLSGLDISHNPLTCDQEFNSVIQWLVDHGVSTKETLRYLSNYGDVEDYNEQGGVTEWVDLAKVICDSIELGPPPRKPPTGANSPKDDKLGKPMPRNDLDDLAKPFDQGRAEKDEQLEDAWISEEQEYEDYALVGANYHPWYAGTLWPVMTVILVTLAIVLVVANFAIYLSKRRGRGPVIRAPMILRPGLIDNKNCGLVYKPLQEEIPTPQMAKRGSFYSSSTFHYDKIVPESV